MPIFSYPKVLFQLNKELDKEMAFCFLGTETGGVNFNDSVLHPHPKLAMALSSLKDKSDNSIKKVIEIYFDEFYSENSIELNSVIKIAGERWKNVEEPFFREVSLIFMSHQFPVGKYGAYLSIINCNPRFLNEKTFQVYYKHNAGSNYIVCHELLHFIFYDYVHEHFPRYKDMNPDNSQLWDVAEIFNSIILSTPQFEKIHGYKERVFYPAHEKYLKNLSAEWNSNKKIDEFIDLIFENLKTT